MKKIDDQLEEMVSEIPRIFLKNMLEEKLKDQGIQNDKFLEALTDHILSGDEEEFHWDDGNVRETNHIDLNITDKQIEDLIKSIKSFHKHELPEAIRVSVNAGARSMLRDLEKRWPEVKIHDRNETQRFRDSLDLRWAIGLDPLRMLLIASREVGQRFAEKLDRSKAKKGVTKRKAILALHMRACQTSMEILTLLENGLSDGAYARWRTLYEISVIALLVDRFGDPIADRYLSHDFVAVREFIVNEYRYEGQKYDPTSLSGYQKRIESRFQAAISQYGKNFASPYGWAADSLGLKKPTFQDLEKAIDSKYLPPEYKMSSFKVHAGVAGTIRTFGTLGDTDQIHIGATNAGLEGPAISTAFSLLCVTSLIFENASQLENQVQMQCLLLLRDKVVSQCGKAAHRLAKDEARLNREIGR